MVKANDTQVGGAHYKGSGYQHWDFITDMYGAGYLVGCATKYIHRHASKNGREDLEKALHYLLKLEEVDRLPMGPNMVAPVEVFCDTTREGMAMRLIVAGMYKEAQSHVGFLIAECYPD